MKDNPIILGVDDATFRFDQSYNNTYLIGVVCQGTRMVEVVKEKIQIDGNDSTESIIKLIKKNHNNIQYVATHTITFGGFNLMDIYEVYNKTHIPIIAVTERKVDLHAVKNALLKRFPAKYNEKISCIARAGNLFETEISTAAGKSKLYYHSIGIGIEEVEKLLEIISIDSKLPECVRMAHIIGRAFRNY
ncbi:MAG: DUF99 family protein [Candidatus Lokiarchaeota archaeon]|nr:DUF99 family protein [Candidatus Lokiarchaeota archaeon]MBD3202359.1 DUF99 family protein [Candidatus Lokiarchaeota archaeon]